MELAQVITKLAAQFQSPLFQLPGISSQKTMAPNGRMEYAQQYAGEYQESAVMILLYPDKNNEAHTVFFERKTSNSVHSGQISLPGGRYEESDKNLMQTAIRETKEEIGVEVEAAKIIGRMTVLEVPVSGFKITPVIAYTEKVPTFIAEQAEVERIIPISIDDLLASNIQHASFPTIHNMKVKAPYYAIGNDQLWGATSMIIAEFKELMK